MKHKDNYNEIYAQLISQGFLDSIGNGVINGVKGIGKGIGKAWNWNKKRIAKNEMNNNIQQILINSNKNITDALLNDSSSLTENSMVINQNINDINDVLPQSIIKKFLLNIKKVGEDTGELILSSNEVNSKLIMDFISKKLDNLKLKFKNEFLKSTFSENISYQDAYLQIIKEAIDKQELLKEYNYINDLLNNSGDIQKLNTCFKICNNIKKYNSLPSKERSDKYQENKQQYVNDLNTLIINANDIFMKTQNSGLIDNKSIKKIGAPDNLFKLKDHITKQILQNKNCAVLYCNNIARTTALQKALIVIMKLLKENMPQQQIKQLQITKKLEQLTTQINKEKASAQKEIQAAILDASNKVEQKKSQQHDIARKEKEKQQQHNNNMQNSANAQEIANALSMKQLQAIRLNTQLERINIEKQTLKAASDTTALKRKEQLDAASDELKLKLQAINSEIEIQNANLKKSMSKAEYEQFQKTNEQKIKAAQIEANTQLAKANANAEDFQYNRQRILKQRAQREENELKAQKEAEDKKTKQQQAARKKQETDADKLKLVKNISLFSSKSLDNDGTIKKLLKSFKKDTANISKYKLTLDMLNKLISNYFAAGLLNKYKNTEKTTSK